MMTLVAVTVFGGALLLVGYVLAATLAPELDRIVAVLRGTARQAPFEPLASLVQAERHIAVRRWAGVAHAPMRNPVRHCEAA